MAKGKINVARPDNAYDKKIAFKIIASFISCISKINNTLIDKAEGLNILMLMYNLIENDKEQIITGFKRTTFQSITN